MKYLTNTSVNKGRGSIFLDNVFDGIEQNPVLVHAVCMAKVITQRHEINSNGDKKRYAFNLCQFNMGRVSTH